MHGSDRVASIVPVGDIVRSVHLIPKFGDTAPQEWKSETILEDCVSRRLTLKYEGVWRPLEDVQALES
jgi:hypothetical protein